jgi:ClpP class serine protease
MRFRERIRNREALAIQADLDVLALMCEVSPPNQDIDGVQVVHIRGPLEHHISPHGDSYEALRLRFGDALKAKPKAVVLRIDSPGGLVSGLNQAVYDMRRAAKNEGVPVYAYVDELCASAAYALACVAEEIVIPPSGIAGSVGVISTMCDQTAANEQAGLRYVTLTSGARKADGHVNVPISEDAIKAEQARVDDLAGQFFRIVKTARGIDAKPLEANIYMGMYAVEAGLADVVMGWEELMVMLHDGEYTDPRQTQRVDTQSQKSNTVARVGKRVSHSASRPRMARDTRTNMLKIQALITSTRAALQAEKDASKRVALRAQLDAFMSTLSALKSPYPAGKKAEKYEDEEEGGNETDREEDDMPGDEPSKKDLPADEEEEEEEGDDKPDMEEEEEEGDDMKDEEEEEEEAKALAALIRGLKGRARAEAQGKLAALVAKARRADAMAADVSALKRAEMQRAKASLIEKKLAGGYITKRAAKDLSNKSLAFVRSYLAMQTTKLYNRAGDELAAPVPGGHAGAFSAEQERMFAQAAAASNGKITVEQLKQQFRSGNAGLAAQTGRY